MAPGQYKEGSERSCEFAAAALETRDWLQIGKGRCSEVQGHLVPFDEEQYSKVHYTAVQYTVV